MASVPSMDRAAVSIWTGVFGDNYYSLFFCNGKISFKFYLFKDDFHVFLYCGSIYFTEDEQKMGFCICHSSAFAN
jgi:hypothetical protein